MTDSKSTKRSLAASIGCIALCVVMLVGTTFAWFTDTATTGVSKVQAGTLDVQLEMYDGENWVSAEGKTLEFAKAKGGEEENVLWEPNCTYELPALRVKNNGNLALKYKIQITGIKGDAKLNEAIDWTISDKVLDTDHKLAAHDTSSNLTIKGTMKSTAGNEYQGLSIEGITVTVVATQDTVEHDSIDSDYDKNATYPVSVSTTDELASAIKAGNDVLLTSEVEIPQALDITKSVTIYGSDTGKLVSTATEAKSRVVNVEGSTDPVTVTLSGVDIVGATDDSYNRAISVSGNSDVTIVLDNCSASVNHYAFYVGDSNSANDNKKVNVTVRNSILTGYSTFQTWTPGTNATFENCTLTGLNQWNDPGNGDNDYAAIVVAGNATDSNLTFKNCRIVATEQGTAKERFLSARASSTVTFESCTFVHNGQELTGTAITDNISNSGNATITIK